MHAIRSHMLKVGIIIGVLCSIVFEMPAQHLSDFKPLLHIQTQWFDIYAPRALEEQAMRLSSFADDSYMRLNDFFGTEPLKRRIPVLISDSAHSLNGYSSLFPSNRIVLFLASADPRGELASMADELKSVFLHELVHSITLNERNSVWKVLAWLGGDWVAPEGWMMPQALVEGTAVWAESRLGSKSASIKESEAPDGATDRESKAAAKSGRLNDPGALQEVWLERAMRQDRSLWDVSGVADFYGAGSLPYLYGGLFADYLAQRFGPETLGRIWRDAASGNIFRGFDGTALSKGILEIETGVKPEKLWDEFLSWIDSGMEKVGEKQEAIELFSGYIGAFDVSQGVVYYFDSDTKAVYARRFLNGLGEGVEPQGKGDNVKEQGAEPGAEFNARDTEPARLFAADENVRTIRCNVKSGTLDIDWIRVLPDGRTIPARYQYDLKAKTLSYLSDLKIPPIGAALAGVQNGSAPENIFLYDPWTDEESGIAYGLVRLGSTILPARRTANSSIEVIDIPGYVVRWISPGFVLDSEESGASRSIRFALTLIPENGISRLGILEEKQGRVSLWIQTTASEGGIREPVFASASKIAYLSSKKNGIKSLNILDIGEIDKESTSASLFLSIQAQWQDAVKWAQFHTLEVAHSDTVSRDLSQNAAIKKTNTLFPALFSLSRIPYVEGTIAGLMLIGSDLSERAAWQAFAGWDFSNWRPMESVQIQLGAGEWHGLFSAVDQSVLFTSPGRVSSVSAGIKWEHSCVPLFRNFSATLRGTFAGFQDAYPLEEVFKLSPDSTSWAIGIDAHYQSVYRSRKPPYDRYGFALAAAAEYEVASRSGFGGISLSGSIKMPGRVGVSAYAAFAPFGGVAFSPALRLLVSGKSAMPSALQAPYPSYREYRFLLSFSNWYTFGEVDLRLFSIEAGWMLRMPLSPSWALRRIIGRIGVRGAGLEIDSTPSALYSAFGRIEFDLALLAGMAAIGHSIVSVEVAWAFEAQKVAGVSPFNINIGVNVEL